MRFAIKISINYWQFRAATLDCPESPVDLEASLGLRWRFRGRDQRDVLKLGKYIRSVLEP